MCQFLRPAIFSTLLFLLIVRSSLANDGLVNLSRGYYERIFSNGTQELDKDPENYEGYKDNKTAQNELLSNRGVLGYCSVGCEARSYLVFLEIKVGNNFYYCSGFVLSKDPTVVVGTAGHCCINGLERITITFNADNFDDIDTGIDDITVLPGPLSIIRHEFYNENPLANDICLLNVATNSEMLKQLQGIRPVALPQPNAKVPTYGLKASGYGLTGAGLLGLPEPCPDDFRSGYEVLLEAEGDQFFYCNGKLYSTCFGDSGGPLVICINGIIYIVGITSTTTVLQIPIIKLQLPCFPGTPNGFTNIGRYVGWINGKVTIAANQAHPKCDSFFGLVIDDNSCPA